MSIMKTYLLNTSTDLKVEVIMTKVKDTYMWQAKNEKSFICNVGEEPEFIQVVYDTTEDIERIGQQLAAIRNQNEMSLRKLEKIVGIKNPYIAACEKGKINASIDSLTRMIAPFGYKVALVPDNI